jgi:molybdopterin synthase catalytic subunit
VVGLGEDALDVAAHEQAREDPRAGAVVSFVRVVRDHDGGRRVSHLRYEAHPDAGSVLTDVARDVASRPGVIAVALSHRVGSLGIGEVALVAAASAAP